jgi:hypothetical protein
VKLERMAARLSVVAALVLGSIFLPSSGLVPHRLSASANVGVQNMFDGFDRCDVPGTGTMSTWFSSSPYYYVGIYIGGDNRACSNTNLTDSWVDTVSGQGWSFIPLYVGLQAPCTSYAHTFSYDTSTANSQGSSSADAAISTAEGLGFSSSIIYFDLEAFDTTNSSCLSAAEAFVSGWDTELKNKGWIDGLYGSGTGSGLTNMYNLGYPYGPTDADIADYSDGYNDPWDTSGVANSLWKYDHRIHQYQADSSCESWGGICLTVDRNCAIGPTAEAKSFSVENTEPSGTSEGDGPSEDVAPCN